MSEEKKKKKGLFKRTKKVASKQLESDRKKSKEKKRLKKAKPKGFGARRAGAITFWVLFSFMFLVVLITLFSSSSNEASEDTEVSEDSKVTSQESVEFAKSFLYDYFNIDGESNENSGSGLNDAAKLKKYLAKNVTEVEVNLGKGKTLKLDRNEIITKEVLKIDEQNSRQTFLVNLVAKRPLTEDELDEVKKLEKDGKDPNEILVDGEQDNDEPTDKKIEGNYEVHYLSMFVTVSIHLKDNNKDFVVSELPSFTYLDESNEDNEIDSKYKDLQEEKDNNIEDNIERFMSTFFESYSQDSKDKLSYILQDEEYQNGLNQTLDFVDISNIKIFNGKSSKEYIVDVDVNFIEPNTEMEMTSNYMLVVAEEGSRYVVKHINNDEYIAELHRKEKEEELDEDSDSDEEESDDEESDDNSDEEEPTEEEIEQEIEDDVLDSDTEEETEDEDEDEQDEEDKNKDEDDKKDKSKSDKA